MDYELFLVIGLIVGFLAVPAVLSAAVDGRSPRTAAIMVLLGGGLIVLAVTRHPGGFVVADLPQVVMRVLGRYIF